MPHRINIVLIPRPSSSINLRLYLSEDQWDRLRKMVYAHSKHTCVSCDAKGVRLHAHESWFFDDENHIQRLEGLVALCEPCHMLNHIGFSENRGDNLEVLAEHYAAVNQCSVEQFWMDRKKAFQVWRKRSSHQWTMDWGETGAWLVRTLGVRLHA